jgi:hypothetical protein
VTQQINFALEFWKLFKAEKALKRWGRLLDVCGIRNRIEVIFNGMLGNLRGFGGLEMEMREI